MHFLSGLLSSINTKFLTFRCTAQKKKKKKKKVKLVDKFKYS